MVNKLIKFTFLTDARHGRTEPQVKICQHTITIPKGVQEWSVEIEDQEQLVIDFFSKTESDTVVDSAGCIVADTEFKILKMWVDDILVETWFRNYAVYRPVYFTGFLQHCPDAPASIVAPYQFNFPGTIEWQWQGSFWDWYFNEKNKNEIINFLDKDPDRVWKFRGSLDPCDDLVDKIKKLIQL